MAALRLLPKGQIEQALTVPAADITREHVPVSFKGGMPSHAVSQFATLKKVQLTH